MPGILPMKVIKMGTSAHLRIAQACDRCRSKKIRCDGVRPCCSQCASVGFECKTSDKLSRRAFPRGYTESLEERVRSLEAEVRELKDLLDEKDEKIDMITRIRPRRLSVATEALSLSPNHSSSLPASNSNSSPATDDMNEDHVIFTIQQAPFLTEDGQPESYFVGTSSGISFLESFKHRMQERGRPTADIKAPSLLRTAVRHSTKPTTTVLSPLQSRPPSRLASDQFVNVFFQEWAPLFPILHRPTFLSLYEQFLGAPEAVTDQKSIAQLYLVFGLAALSQGISHQAELPSIELQWQNALQQIQTDQCLATLQCLLLAQLYCMQKGDCSQLLTYKALAVSLACRLGLPQSQKRFSLGTLTCETRKKVFWTLYTIDCFSAVQLGLPRQIKDEEVFCEMPVDADDEYVTERGFQPLLPGESTRVSSALALFRAAKVLSKVLAVAYPALPSYEISSRQISALAEELDEWQASLAPHLRLPFAQDKPSAGNVSSRSPFLSLTYHFIRALVHRPVVCASSESSEASSSMLALANSSKHVTQILNLLTERGLSFSFCLNKEELLVLSGFGLLMQGLELEDGSKIMKDNQKMLALVIVQLDRMKAPEVSEFRRIACVFLPPVPIHGASPQAPAFKVRHASEGSMPAPQQQFNAMSRPQSSENTNIGHDAMNASQSEPSRSPQELQTTSSTPMQITSTTPALTENYSAQFQTRPRMNLDYLSFSTGASTPGLEMQGVHPGQQSDWERLLATIDNGQTNIFDNIYGGPPVDLLGATQPTVLPQHSSQANQAADDALAWDPKIWALNGTGLTQPVAQPGGSEFSFSTQSESRSGSLAKTSLDGSSPDEHDLYHGVVLPEMTHSDDGVWDSVDQSYTMV